MPDITATVFPNEAYVLIQTDWSGTLLRDTFQRIAALTWQPSADTGQVWALDTGLAADFPVNGTQGQMIHTAVPSTKRIRATLGVVDADASGVFYNPYVPTGANEFVMDVFLRYVDVNNFANARFRFTVAGTVTVQLRYIIGGVATNGATITVAGLPNSGVYGFRFLAQGSTLAARIWAVGTPEPTTWNTTLTTTWLTAGDIVMGTVVSVGITNPLPLTFAFDNIVVVDPNAVMAECAIVTRRNTVTGEIIQLRPYIFYDADGALMLECGQGLWWDTEPPLNVPLEYCTFSCDAAVTLNANPSFELGTAGWTVSNGTLAQDCTIAHDGACSGRLTPNGTNGNPAVIAGLVTFVAGRLVTASGWAMTPQGWNSVFLRLRVNYVDLTSEILETEMVTLDDNEWRFLSLSFTPRVAVNSATFSFHAAGLPPNTTLFYVDDMRVTQLADVTASDCVTVTVESDSVWLKNPLHPCLDVEVGLCSPMVEDCDEDSRVSYAGTVDDSYAANTALLSPVNREFPIPMYRIRRAPTATLSLIAHDCDARDAILAANKPGNNLLFQAPADYCIPDRYITVGNLDEVKIGVDQREDFRLMSLPYATVEREDGPMDGPCGARFEDLCDIYTSWAALAAAGLTWTDLLMGQASPDGPGQPEPPAAARTWDDVEIEFVDWDAVEAGGTRDWDELRDGL